MGFLLLPLVKLPAPRFLTSKYDCSRVPTVVRTPKILRGMKKIKLKIEILIIKQFNIETDGNLLTIILLI